MKIISFVVLLLFCGVAQAKLSSAGSRKATRKVSSEQGSALVQAEPAVQPDAPVENSDVQIGTVEDAEDMEAEVARENPYLAELSAAAAQATPEQRQQYYSTVEEVIQKLSDANCKLTYNYKKLKITGGVKKNITKIYPIHISNGVDFASTVNHWPFHLHQ